MHILFLTDNFPPEVNAPASRTYEHCREWTRAGHKVTVVTCFPNFPKGKIFPGYRNKLWQVEFMDGIRVVRLWTYITANEGFFKRTIDYLSFMVSAVMASPFIEKADIVIGTSPQFFTVCAAFIVSRIMRIPFIFEVRDLWPESLKAVGALKNAVILRSLEFIELFLYRRASRVISVTNSFKENLVKRGISPQKIAVINNGADLTRFKPMQRDYELKKAIGLNGKLIAGYVGTHGMAHGLDTILESARIIQSHMDNNEIQFLLIGDGAEKNRLKKKANDMGLKNIIFLDSVSKDQVVRYWSLLDVAIIHLKKEKLFETVIPSKLFEAMAMGIPILHGVKGESAEIVKKEGIGMVFEPENYEELANILLNVYINPELVKIFRQNALNNIQKYDRKHLAQKMLSELLDVYNTKNKKN